MKALKVQKMMAGAASLALVLALAACASSPSPSATQEMENVSGKVEQELIGWKGRDVGVQMPQWLQDANVNVSALAALPQFEGKVIMFTENQGKNLDLLKSWANNFDVQGTVARRIQNRVQATFGGTQEGDKDDAERTAFQQEVIATFSNVQVHGLSRELDFWTQVRIRDRELKTVEDEYHYYAVYAIDRDILQEQIETALGHVDAANAEQQGMKDDVRKAMADVRALTE